jgi:hypothetical protein
MTDFHNSRRAATNVASSTHTGVGTTFVTRATSVVSVGQEAIETTFVAAGPLRAYFYPGAVDVRDAARAVESLI